MHRFLLAAALAFAAGACIAEDDVGTDDVALAGDDADWAYEAPALAAIPLDAEPCATALRLSPKSFDGQVETGRSCLTCHVNGELAKNDQIRKAPIPGGARRP